MRPALSLIATTCTLLAACATPATTGPMSFFVTSAGVGKGAELGGLAGADPHCQKLATAAGAGAKTWHAYLSAQGRFAPGSGPALPPVHARAASATAPGSMPRANSSPVTWPTCTTATSSAGPQRWTNAATASRAAATGPTNTMS